MTQSTFIFACPRACLPEHRNSFRCHLHKNSRVRSDVSSLIILLLSLSSVHGRIVGGTPATDGEYPYFVHTRGIVCGGTLIHSDIVLTAAHCDEGFAIDKTIYIGAVQLSGEGDESNTVKQLLLHPQYNTNTSDNDIMLIKLASTSSSPVAQWNTKATVPASNSKVNVIGFGATSEGGSVSSTLLEVELTVQSSQTCVETMGANTALQICAGETEGGKDSCQGDSGGPLLVDDTVVGIVSVGAGCARPNTPGINTRVSAYTQFIKDGICTLSSDPPEWCVAAPEECSLFFCCDR
ncbi:transmembrane protease serine 6 [Fistulifera solaris]|uniref:Transmembrane protease serine 6 n=1 Tax=Fistulifera solaris TaxID=1519565 RepID=A0A1Z5JLE8_FISSO|nr:transmembrane protease serine 6 [Fistulifera solaris]|eukprot:GAX14814.1 transmembrane protease serine 6 [Fistulifera solaris]